jgi:hypothetical protein
VKLTIRNQQDFFAGLMFILFGVIALVVGKDYGVGNATRMGPGYFPRMVAALLTAVGILIALRALAFQGPKVGSLAVRPLALVSVSVVAFALLLQPGGLVVAVTALVLIACAGAWKLFSLRDVAILLVVLLVMAVGVFYYGIKLPLNLWPW